MKKFLFAGFAAAILAGCSSEPENVTTILDAKCETVATGAEGNFVVKCPVTEQLTEIQSKEADSMFVSGRDYYDFDAYAADAEHIYVEVNPNASNGDQPIYRVMVKTPVFDENAKYSVMYVVPVEPAVAE